MILRFVSAIAVMMIATFGATPNTFAEVTFVFTFFDVTTSTGAGFDDPAMGAARREALEAVAAEIGARIGQTATVEIGVAPSQTDGTGPIGIGSATFLDTTPGIRDGEVYRRIVLGEPDVDAGLDGGIVFDFGYDVVLSGPPIPGVACFRDVARHELTHVLGFGSFIEADGKGFNGTAPDMYTRFDSMLETDSGDGEGLKVVDDDGNLLLDSATFGAAHGTGLVFDGPETRGANGGMPFKMFGSDPTHSATGMDVMFPSPAVGVVRTDWTDREAAVLKDLGYMILPAGEGSGGGGDGGGDGGDGSGDIMTGDCGACAPSSAPLMAMIAAGVLAMKRLRRRRR
jgi:hypothetical protein